MSKLGMGSLAVLTAGGILSALNMRRVTKQRERTMTRAMRRTEWEGEEFELRVGLAQLYRAWPEQAQPICTCELPRESDAAHPDVAATPCAERAAAGRNCTSLEPKEPHYGRRGRDDQRQPQRLHQLVARDRKRHIPHLAHHA